MLTNVNLFIETMQAGHRHTESVLALLSKLCTKTALPDVQSECEQLRMVLRDTDSMFGTLRDASTADLSSILRDIKKYASDAVAAESQQLQASVQRSSQTVEANLNDRFKKLEARVLSELAAGGSEESGAGGATGLRAKGGDAGLLKKVMNRVGDFEQQVASQLSLMSADIEKKIAFIQSQPRGGPNFMSGGGNSGGLDSLGHDVLAMKYDVGELKDLMNAAKGDAAHMKRIVLACERDMEDFTAAMDAVNVDLDEMRARVDATHSIITSRQRVEATVTAEISTMRLDMGDMQEALKAHDAWMEDVSQSLQEAHERCHQLAEDLAALRDQTQQKLDAKTDISAWNDMNDDIDASIKTVRDMASALRLEVDSRRRKVDETLNQMRGEMRQLEGKVDANHDGHRRFMDETHAQLSGRLDEHAEAARGLQDVTSRHQEIHREIQTLIEEKHAAVEARHSQMEADLRKQDEDFHKEINDRVDAVERHQASVGKESSKRLNALDLRISGLQGATGELKRDTNKLRDEVNSLTVKSAAHDVDIGKNCDDLRRMERQRAEDNQRHKQDMDGVYEELDQKVYEKSFQTLEDHVTKLTRGTVKLCQVVGVFPGARMNDGTEEELDVDVELLNWEDCAQNLTGRVEKVWRQVSSQKYRSILDLVSKKADHSVLRLLQISQQHIESQLDRVRHERELWKEVVDKRSQQPLQLALTLKDPHTGLPIAGPPPPGFQGAGMPGMAMGFNPMAMGGPGNPVTPPSFLAARPVPAAMQNPMMAQAQDPLAQTAPLGTGALVDPRMSVDPTMKAAGAPAQAPTPLAKRIAKPPGPPPPPQR